MLHQKKSAPLQSPESYVSLKTRTLRLGKILIAGFALQSCSLGGNQAVGYNSQINIGEQFLRDGQYQQGYTLLNQVATTHSNSSEVHLSLGDAYFRTGALLKASAAYKKAAETGAPTKGRIGLGRVELRRNNFEGALAQFASVLQTEPANNAALIGQGVAYDIGRQHSTAQQSYRQVLANDPANVDAVSNLGLSLSLSGRADEAVQILSELTQSNLDNPQVRQNLALAHKRAGNHDAAMKIALLDLREASAQSNLQAISGYRWAN